MNNIYLRVLAEYSTNASVALATVTGSSGSTPQKGGSSALFNESGLISGTVGGGVVEGRLQKIACEAIKLKHSAYFSFDLSGDISNKEEAICGGKVTVLVDANLQNSIGIFNQMQLSLANQIPGVLVTMVNRFSEEIVLVNRYWITEKSDAVLPPDLHTRIKEEADKMILEAKPHDFRELSLSLPDEEPSSLFFLEAVLPLPKLIIAGAGHIGRSLAHLGKLLDFEVTVIDDRAEYANHSNIPDASHIIVGDIGVTMDSVPKDSNTYVVIVSRGHKDDAQALKPCVGKGLAYIGMIGSKTKVEAMRRDFIENGWASDVQWKQVNAPVGLPIGSQTVAEIAVSIAAQLVLFRSKR